MSDTLKLIKFVKTDVFKAFSTGFLVGAALLGVAVGTGVHAQEPPVLTATATTR